MRGFPLELSTITFSLNVTVTVILSFNLYPPSFVFEETEETVSEDQETEEVQASSDENEEGDHDAENSDEKNSKDASKITAARRSYVKSINNIWYMRRDNVLAPVKKMFNFEIPSKKLNDFNMEIWCMNQIQDEDEPYELLFDTESGQEEG